MKICLPYPFSGIGGPMTFVRNLTPILRTRGHSVTQQLEVDFDVLLIIEKCRKAYLKQAKKNHAKIIQRLDGVYHPGLPGLKKYLYRWKNRDLKNIHNHWADHIVYQSENSRDACRKFLGTPTTPYTIIYNGAAILTEAPKRTTAHTPPRFLTFANFRRSDQIAPIIEALKSFPKAYTLDIFGPYTRSLKPLFQSTANHPTIHYRGLLPNQNRSDLLQNYDLFLFSDHSPCPNAVIEALAAGLPVVAFARGGVPELVSHNQSGYITSVSPHNPWTERYQFTKLDLNSFQRGILEILETYPTYRLNAYTEAKKRFPLETMVTQYEKIFRQNPEPTHL